MDRPTHPHSELHPDGFTRREFLSAMLTTSCLAGVAGGDLLAAGAENGIPYRKLGRTGERVSLVGLGGYHIGMQSDEQESIKIIRTALNGGINFLDNCWDYNGGKSGNPNGKALSDR